MFCANRLLAPENTLEENLENPQKPVEKKDNSRRPQI
jgi:hypothetical protein